MNRLLYFHPLDILNSRNSMDRERYIRFLQVQQTLGIKRKLLDITYFGGSTWWSLSRTCVEYLIRNKCENNIYASMQDTYIPDEMFVQTLLLNSPMKEFLRMIIGVILCGALKMGIFQPIWIWKIMMQYKRVAVCS